MTPPHSHSCLLRFPPFPSLLGLCIVLGLLGEAFVSFPSQGLGHGVFSGLGEHSGDLAEFILHAFPSLLPPSPPILQTLICKWQGKK